MARKPSLPEHIRALLRREAYPHSPPDVQLVQTHLSWVFLAGEEVYKLKKPIDIGFANFTTLARRKAACESEVRLNRRGCPGSTYVGFEPVTRSRNSFHIGGEGEIVDYAVHMKRLPAEGMMNRLLEQGAVSFNMIGRLAARLSALHADADRGPKITKLGGSKALKENWRENFEQIAPFIGRTLARARYDRIEKFAVSFLKREAELLGSRDGEGWVRDCHGDLRSDSVVFDDGLPGGICIYDCIEFNDRFRYVDTALDAAFLAMDLDYRGHSDYSDLFIGLFTAASGDKCLPLLLDFYKCYRACVRGKVESLLLADDGVPSPQKRDARRRARTYFELAESYAKRQHSKVLLLVLGPSGSGKSVLAGVLASRLGAVLLSTDMVRRELFERHPAPTQDSVDEGRYAPTSREAVYGTIEDQVQQFASEQRRLVVDGTYIERKHRAPVITIAGRAKMRLLVVECSAPDDVIRRRQEQRQAEAWTTSEGRWDVYLAQKQRMEPADEVPPANRVSVDTTMALNEQVAVVLGKLRRS